MLGQIEELVQRIRRVANPCEIRVHPEVMRAVEDEYKRTFGQSLPQHNFVNTVHEVPIVSVPEQQLDKIFIGFRMEVKRGQFARRPSPH
jgi:hypothetical protein